MKIDASLSYKHVLPNPLANVQGKNGSVHVVEELQLNSIMVAKEIPKTKFHDPSEYFAEAQRAHAAEHKNIVPIQYACEKPDKICLVMPYLRKGSLASRIAQGPLTEREAIRVGVAVLAGLEHIHRQQLIHFDVKPSNVLFSDLDEPCLADFGQATLQGPLGTVRAPPLYPNAYPPEVYEHATGSAQTDIYHTGLLLYRAVNGEPHYAKQVPATEIEHEIRTLKGKFPDRSSFLPHVSQRMRTIIRKALKVKPAERYQTATEMSAALARLNLDLDWVVNVGSTKTTWQAHRSSPPDLVVELEREPVGTWAVTVYTRRASRRRAKDPSKFARAGLSEADALTHLNDVVFPSLP